MRTRPFPSPATSRWTALLTAAVALLFAAPLLAADKNPEYISLAGLKAAGFQKWLDDAKDQGYEPYYINGCDVGDHVEFSGVAIKSSRTFEARFDLSDDEYRDFFKEMSAKGFRPTFVSGYHSKGGPRFAAVWIKSTDPRAWKAKHNQLEKDFEGTLDEMRDNGLFLTCATAYQGPDGGVRYTSIIEAPAKGVKWASRHNMTADQFDDQLDKWRSGGWQMMKFHLYDSPDGVRFLAVAMLKDNNDARWKVRHGMTGDEYQKEFDRMAEEGYRPTCICGYREEGKVRFAASWVKYGK